MQSESWIGVFEKYLGVYRQGKWEKHLAISVDAVAYVWERYGHSILVKPVRLLWILSFLKVYPPNVQILETMWKVERHTFLNIVFHGIEGLASMLDEVGPLLLVCLLNMFRSNGMKGW